MDSSFFPLEVTDPELEIRTDASTSGGGGGGRGGQFVSQNVLVEDGPRQRKSYTSTF